jgi:hypothetical protein
MKQTGENEEFKALELGARREPHIIINQSFTPEIKINLIPAQNGSR